MARKKAAAASAADEFETMMNGFANSEVDDEPDAEAGNQDDIDALRGQIAGLTSQLSQLQSERLSWMSQPTAPVQQQQQVIAPQPPSFDDLPDPLDDPKGYAAAVRDRTRQTIEAERRAEQQRREAEAAASARYEGLWNDFSTTHADHAADPELVEFAAQKAAKKAIAKGVDVQRYMFSARDQFFKDVVAEIDAIRGPRSPSDDTDDDTDEDLRTMGLPGGFESGGRPTPKRKAKPGPSMSEVINDFQMKGRFY